MLQKYRQKKVSWATIKISLTLVYRCRLLLSKLESILPDTKLRLQQNDEDLSDFIAVFIFAIAYLQSIEVATIVGLAMLASIFAAVFIAILIPWVLSKFQRDPAFGSSPFATLVQDKLSIIIYFTVATLILFR